MKKLSIYITIIFTIISLGNIFSQKPIDYKLVELMVESDSYSLCSMNARIRVVHEISPGGPGTSVIPGNGLIAIAISDIMSIDPNQTVNLSVEIVEHSMVHDVFIEFVDNNYHILENIDNLPETGYNHYYQGCRPSSPATLLSKSIENGVEKVHLVSTGLLGTNSSNED